MPGGRVRNILVGSLLGVAAAGCDDNVTERGGGLDAQAAGGVSHPRLGDAATGDAMPGDLGLMDGPPPAEADGGTGGGAGSADAYSPADLTPHADGQPVAEGCQAVDILVMADDSGSMADNQQSLAASFPGFVNKIRERLSYARSYHIGVVTSDDYAYNASGCQTIGDLVTQTGGPESGNMVCGPFAEGHRFMTERDFDLLGAFSCAASVGSGGNDDERPMRGILNAVSPERNGPGG